MNEEGQKKVLGMSGKIQNNIIFFIVYFIGFHIIALMLMPVKEYQIPANIFEVNENAK